MDREDGQADEVKSGSPRATRTLLRRAVSIAALAAIFLGVLLVRSWQADTKSTPAKQLTANGLVMPTSAAIEQKFGVRFTGVDITSAGGMIQVRYQVLDSAKVEAIHDNTSAPYVVDGSGKKYADPGMVGHSHIGPVAASGRSDYVLLANAGGGVKAGSTVTIKIGDLELRNVPVD